jgi:predicted ester cyclase
MDMSVQEMQRLDDQGIKTWGEHDPEAWVAMFADRFEWSDDAQPGLPSTKESAKQYMQAWLTAFPDLKLKTLNRVVSDDAVGAEFEFSGTNKGPLVLGDQTIPATNKKVVTHGTYFAKAKNGKIVEFHNHPNVIEMMDQLGINAM